MRCPRCESEKLSVIDSRSDGDAIRRRRECQQCEYRFTTYERVSLTLPMVMKKDDRREAFSRDKIRSGVVRACEKRPVGLEEIERLVESVERQIADRCVKEIPSMEIGEILMESLRKLDKVAYVRFASVYREFSDPKEFVETLQSLDRKNSLSGSSQKKVANE